MEGQRDVDKKENVVIYFWRVSNRPAAQRLPPRPMKLTEPSWRLVKWAIVMREIQYGKMPNLGKGCGRQYSTGQRIPYTAPVFVEYRMGVGIPKHCTRRS